MYSAFDEVYERTGDFIEAATAGGKSLLVDGIITAATAGAASGIKAGVKGAKSLAKGTQVEKIVYQIGDKTFTTLAQAFEWFKDNIPSAKQARAIIDKGGVVLKDAIAKINGAKTNGLENLKGKFLKRDNLYKHQYNYDQRIRNRALNDPVAHNFPYSYDDIILKTKPIIQSDGSLMYVHKGYLNSKEGFFEIGLNPKSGTIFHRNFNGSKNSKYGK